jgi:DNA-binding response OmpR family regulator
MTPSGAVAAITTPAVVRLRAAAPGHRRPEASARRRILLCDDESQTLHALRVVLHRAGFEVDATRSAGEALDRSALWLPAAAISDLVLPDGDGVDLCRRLREWSTMPVILLSAPCNEDEQVRAFEAGADDYVTKPFRPRELVAACALTSDEPSPEERNLARNSTASKSTSRHTECAATVRRST